MAEEKSKESTLSLFHIQKGTLEACVCSGVLPSAKQNDDQHQPDRILEVTDSTAV